VNLDFWDLKTPMEKIKKFVKAAKNKGWIIEVFIDAGMSTEEAHEKWIKRREE
jgi:hypothetical protein